MAKTRKQLREEKLARIDMVKATIEELGGRCQQMTHRNTQCKHKAHGVASPLYGPRHIICKLHFDGPYPRRWWGDWK